MNDFIRFNLRPIFNDRNAIPVRERSASLKQLSNLAPFDKRALIIHSLKCAAGQKGRKNFSRIIKMKHLLKELAGGPGNKFEIGLLSDAVSTSFNFIIVMKS